jgi:tetratricopeptide (TPR) repeat protein
MIVRSVRPVPTRWRILASTLLCLVALAPTAHAARSAAEAIAAGDQAYAAARLGEARQAYAEAVQSEPRNVTALCRLSRAESESGESASTHVWLAVALGRQALREGARTKLAISKEIKAEADRALALDAHIGRAWHVLAMWNIKVASLNAIERMAANAVLGGVPKGASFENAEAAFKKAIALEPEYVNHRLEYGRLLKDLKRTADARRELERAVALSGTSSALDARYQSEAKALLEKLPR